MEKINVVNGEIEIEGKTWSLFARKYFEKKSFFMDECDNVIEIKDDILIFQKKELTAPSAQNLQNRK